jgi:5-(carboxyamino)imidazole ribonucleotide synthase
VLKVGLPLVLKTRRYGYDGKGQAWVHSRRDEPEAWAAIGEEPAIAEAAISFEAEFSVILARWADGRHAYWDSPRNEHEGGILRRSTVPGGDLVAPQVEEARAAALRIAEALNHVGVLTVEFFASGDGPLVNEIAPRVHNSGHWTIEGAVTSQFEQHIRAICDLAPGLTGLTRGGAVMENLIGAEIGRWPELAAERGTHLHIYGKGEARPGRKMGHITRVVR